MRRLFTTDEARRCGLSSDALRWGDRVGRWRRIERGVYGDGPEPPTRLDQARARVMATDAVASGSLAAVLHGLDGVTLDRRPTRRRILKPGRTIMKGGVRCTNGLQTMLDLAEIVDDRIWEQALESALRQRLTTIAEIEAELPELARARTRGTARIRRVLALRPPGAPATESILETLMVQLARTIAGLDPPTRQYEVYNQHGGFVARVDLSWPSLGVFIELDGQQHPGQPVYDASRETSVVAATGWLCGRFTWHEVVHVSRTTARKLEAVVEQARRRPPAA